GGRREAADDRRHGGAEIDRPRTIRRGGRLSFRRRPGVRPGLSETLDFIVRHGYSVLFAWMAAEQLGLPIPAIPLLLAAGALAGAGRLSLALVLVVSVIASLLADTLWYEIGRRRGVRVLQFLCRVSLEPDSCVRRTELIF